MKVNAEILDYESNPSGDNQRCMGNVACMVNKICMATIWCRERLGWEDCIRGLYVLFAPRVNGETAGRWFASRTRREEEIGFKPSGRGTGIGSESLKMRDRRAGSGGMLLRNNKTAGPVTLSTLADPGRERYGRIE